MLVPGLTNPKVAWGAHTLEGAPVGLLEEEAFVLGFGGDIDSISRGVAGVVERWSLVQVEGAAWGKA